MPTPFASRDTPLTPLRFEPLCQYRLWGGRRLASLLRAPLPGDGPIGEAWVLSDREDHQSRVADGPLRGTSLAQLREQWPEALMGRLAGRFRRFPLLLKFLDAHAMLSVQVHPSDEDAKRLAVGDSGKTEAWVVLEAGPDARVYAGLVPGVSLDDVRRSIVDQALPQCLASFRPHAGDAVLVPAGTVHALGDLVVFEVQQNSDVTYRLYDWNRVDAATGAPRPLQIEEALACIDVRRGPVANVVPRVETTAPALRERLFDCDPFCLWRVRASVPFEVGEADAPRVLVCLDGEGEIVSRSTRYPFQKGDVLLLPAVVGVCECHGRGVVTMLELCVPDVPHH